MSGGTELNADLSKLLAAEAAAEAARVTAETAPTTATGSPAPDDGEDGNDWGYEETKRDLGVEEKAEAMEALRETLIKGECWLYGEMGRG